MDIETKSYLEKIECVFTSGISDVKADVKTVSDEVSRIWNLLAPRNGVSPGIIARTDAVERQLEKIEKRPADMGAWIIRILMAVIAGIQALLAYKLLK